MEVDALVILLIVFAGHESGFLIRILCHDAGCNSLLDFGIEMLDAVDYHLLRAVLRAPDGERGTPVAAAREVPVLQILEPLAETA